MSMGSFAAFHVAVPTALSLLNFYSYPLFPFLLKRLDRGGTLPLALSVPACWVVTEWVRVLMSADQLQMYYLGSSQFRWSSLIQIADSAGVYGVSFLVAAVNGAIADGAVRRAPDASPRVAHPRRWMPAVATAILFAAAIGYGEFRIRQAQLRPGPRIAVVQPNESHYRERARNAELVARQILFTRESVPAGASDLIVWPENAVSDLLNLREDYLEELAALAREKESHLLVGAYALPRPGRQYTSAYFFSPKGEALGRYDKIHLIFWSEHMPLTDLFGRRFKVVADWEKSLARATLGWAGAGTRGQEVSVFELAGKEATARFSTPICFETTSAELWRTAARNHADFLVNITSEGVMGYSTYTHLLALASFRAVENRISVIRAANNGLSAFVDPNGRIQSVIKGRKGGARYGERGVLIDRVMVDPRRGTTFYTAHGDVFVALCAAVIAAALAAGTIRARRSSLPATDDRHHHG